MSIFTALYNKTFPEQPFRKHKKSRKPWISQRLYKRIVEKNRLFAQFIQTKEPNLFVEYKQIRNKLGADIKKARNEYYLNKFQTCHSSRQTWSMLNQLIGANKNRIDTPFTHGG